MGSAASDPGARRACPGGSPTPGSAADRAVPALARCCQRPSAAGSPRRTGARSLDFADPQALARRAPARKELVHRRKVLAHQPMERELDLVTVSAAQEALDRVMFV